MARKRASLAGRGVEILFGGEPETPEDAETTPEAPPTESTSEQPPGDAEGGMQADWAAMLEAEAATATTEVETADEAEEAPAEPVEEPAPVAEFGAEDGRPDWPAVSAEPADEVLAPVAEAEPGEPLLGVAEPEEELPPLATTPAQPATGIPLSSVTGGETMTREPSAAPGPVYGPQTPPAPMYTERHAEPGTAGAPLPPPRDKPEAYDPVVRAQLVGALYTTSTETPPDERLLPDGPTAGALELRGPAEYELGQPSQVRSERDILEYVGLKQRQVLWQEITELYKEVPEVLCTDDLQDDALQLLQEAQDILMEKPRQFDVAQYKTSQVQTIVVRRKNTNRWTNTYGWGTFLYETLWFIVLAAGILFAPLVVNWVNALVGDATSSVEIPELWNTAMWGGIGGVLGALYSLYWHAAKVRDFDKQYLMWYVVQPVIGLVIGAVVYIIIGAGFINVIGETAAGQKTALSLFPYAVAFVAAFRQRFVLEVIDRFIQFVTGANRQKQQAAQAQTTGSGSTSASS